MPKPSAASEKGATGVAVAGRTVPWSAPPPSFADPDALPADAIARLRRRSGFRDGAGARTGRAARALRQAAPHVDRAGEPSHRNSARGGAAQPAHAAKLGFVAADDARRFYLRPRVLSFSHAYLSASPIAVLAQPILDRLGESLREACSLAMLDGDEIVYLARSTSSRIMSPSLNVGRRLPAYCTSIGHVMLAHLPQDELDAYLARARFHPYTEHTPNTAEKLVALLTAVRESGFAFASQMMEPRLCTLAVPVRDAGGHYVAGINVILQGRLFSRREMAERFYHPLQQAALELGSLLLP